MQSHGSHGKDDKDHLDLAILYFPAICLALGMVIDSARTRLFAKLRFSIPATVFLLLVSSICSCLLHQFLEEDDRILEIVRSRTWISKDPHEIMLLLLPILVFESSFSLHAHDFYHHIWMILALAILGFLLSVLQIQQKDPNEIEFLGSLMFLMMVVLAEIEGWGFIACFTYATLISATDPVAVVALLSELGAPSVLHVLIDGEALVNDGAAIILFKLLSAGLKGEALDRSWLENGGRLLAGVLVSVMIGYLWARAVMWVVTSSHNDVTKDQGFVLFGVILVFAVCEHIPFTHIEGSGVLGLVFFGVTLSGRRDDMNPKSVEVILHLWEFMAYWANTVVFILSGLWIGKYMVINKGSGTVYPALWWYGGLIAYIFSLVARGVVIYTIIGVKRILQLRQEQAHLSWEYVFMMFWAGLRGAVALLLALQLKIDSIDQSVQDFTLMFVGVTVLLSLAVQGGTYAMFAQCTGLNERSAFVRKRMRQRIFQLKNHEAKNILLSAVTNPKLHHMSETHWPWIWQVIISTLKPKHHVEGFKYPWQKAEEEIKLTSHQTSNLNSQYELLVPDLTEAMPLPFTKKPTPSLLKIGQEKVNNSEDALNSYLHILRSRLAHMWEKRVFTGRTVRSINTALDVAIDRGDPLNIDQITNTVPVPSVLEAIARLSRCLPEIKRDYYRSYDWWLCVMDLFSILLWAFILYAHYNENFIKGTYLILFFASIAYVVERIALCHRRFKSHDRMEEDKMRYFFKFYFYADVVFTIVDLALVVVTGHALNYQTCFIGKIGSFNGGLPFCGTSVYLILITYSVRAGMKLPFTLFLLAQLSLEKLNKFLTKSVHMSRIGVLLALIRMADDVGYGLLAKVIPGQANLEKACHHNMILKKTAEKAMAAIIAESPEQFKVYRLIQTRQAARYVLNRMEAKIKAMEEEGILTMDEFKELQAKVKKGFVMVNKWVDAKEVPEPLLEHQILKICWLQHGSAKEKKNLFTELKDPYTLKTEDEEGMGLYPKGHVFFDESHPPDKVFILLSGLAEYRQQGVHYYIYPGSMFGEKAFLDETAQPQDWTESVIAVTEVIARYMSRDTFDELKWRYPRIKGIMGMEASLMICRDVLIKYRPFSDWKPEEVFQHLKHQCYETRRGHTRTVPPRNNLLILAGGLKFENMEGEEEVVYLEMGQKPVLLEPGCRFTLFPLDDQKTCMIAIPELKDTLLAEPRAGSHF